MQGTKDYTLSEKLTKALKEAGQSIGEEKRVVLT